MYVCVWTHMYTHIHTYVWTFQRILGFCGCGVYNLITFSMDVLNKNNEDCHNNDMHTAVGTVFWRCCRHF